jgi:hypothetical protein
MLGCSENRPKANRGPSKNPALAGNEQRPAARHAGAAPEIGQDSSEVVRFGGVELVPIKGWVRKPPQSSFTIAEFMLPRAEGDDADGRLTLSTAGGTIEANVNRWKEQFTGRVENADTKQLDCNGVKVTFVDLSGDYSDQRGPYSPETKRPGYRMIAAIIPVDDQLHFVKAVGPQKTMEAQAENLKTFIHSVRRIG